MSINADFKHNRAERINHLKIVLRRSNENDLQTELANYCIEEGIQPRKLQEYLNLLYLAKYIEKRIVFEQSQQNYKVNTAKILEFLEQQRQKTTKEVEVNVHQ